MISFDYTKCLFREHLLLTLKYKFHKILFNLICMRFEQLALI